MLTLLACACPSFEEMSVTDPDGATEADRSLVQEVIDGFAAATGRDGVCVPAVELRAGEDPRLAGIDGLYRGPHDTILVEQGQRNLAKITRHELCHALDDQEGLSAGRAHLFPPDTILDRELYPSRADRVGEAFARACSEDPVIDLSDALETCQGASESEAWLAEHVYPFAEPAFDRVPATLTRSVLSAPAKGGELRNLAMVDDTPVFTTVYWGDHRDTFAREPEISTVDLTTGARRGVQTVPVGLEYARVSAIGGDAALLLVSREETEVWAYDPDVGTLTAVDGFPEIGPWAEVYGTVVDRTVWFTDIADRAPTFESFDLDSHERTTVAWPDELAEERLTPVTWLEADGRLYGSTHVGLLAYDPAGDTWEIIVPPGEPVLMGMTLWGRSIVAYTYARNDGVYERTVLLYDLDTGRWALPDDPCEAAALAGGQPFTLDGELGVWEGTSVARIHLD